MKEQLERLDKDLIIDKNVIIDNARNSYISKEQFIYMLQNLDFLQIKEARLRFITGFKTKYDDKGNCIVETLGFDIDID